GQRRQGLIVGGGLDDDFVGADAVHFVVDAVPLAREVAFHAERRELVGNDADGPVRRAGSALRTIGQDFRRRLGLIAVAKGAEALAGGFDRLDAVVVGALGAVAGDNDPAASDGIFAEFRHGRFSSRTPQRSHHWPLGHY